MKDYQLKTISEALKIIERLELENQELKDKLRKQNDRKLAAQKKYQKSEKGKLRSRVASKKYYEKMKKKRELEKLKFLKHKYEKVDTDSIEDTITEEQQLLIDENPNKYGIK